MSRHGITSGADKNRKTSQIFVYIHNVKRYVTHRGGGFCGHDLIVYADASGETDLYIVVCALRLIYIYSSMRTES